MRVWWLTTGPMFTPTTSLIADIAQCQIPDLKLTFAAAAGLSATTIRRSIDVSPVVATCTLIDRLPWFADVRGRDGPAPQHAARYHHRLALSR